MTAVETPLISLQSAGRQYTTGSAIVTALTGVSLTVLQGDYLAITGPEGAGKSTLIRLLALLNRPTSGSCSFMGRETAALSDTELAALRNRYISLITNGSVLIPHLTVLDNVKLPLRYRGLAQHELDEPAEAALASVHMTHSANHYPSRLSALEVQLVALARASASGANLILCDEPFVRLTESARKELSDVLRAMKAQGRTLICASADAAPVATADRTVYLAGGRLVSGGEAACG